MFIFKYSDDNKFSLFKAVAILVVTIYFSVILYYSLNIPYWDDYVVTLRFFYEFFESQSFLGKVEALLAQWSEHRIVLGRILAIFQYYFQGVLNFRVLHFTANLSLILLYLGILKSTAANLRKWLVLPVALFLFQLQYYVASFWFVSSSSMFFVLLFALLSFYFFKKGKYLFCILYSLLAIFSNGNGFLVLLFEIVFLLRIRNYKMAFVFVSIFILSMLLYFKGYLPHENDRMATLYFIKQPIQTAEYFLIFIGGCLNVFNGAAVLIGLLSICGVGFITFKKYYFQNSTIYLMIMFVLGSALLAAIGRSFWGIDQALESRYKIFSVVFWVCLLISFLEIHKVDFNSRIFSFLFIIALIFNIGSYYKSWPFMLRFLESQKNDYQEVISGIPRKNLNEAHEILLESKSKGYFK